jgi:hypothetical protein
MLSKLTETECRAAIASGDFSAETRTSAPAVALVLTQSWCPQWRFMNAYLGEAERAVGDRVAIRYIEYDNEPFFEEFMTFKEDVFGNRSVPYVRYYREGKLVAESNFISKQGFLAKLGIA